MVNLSSHQLYVFLVAAETLNYTQAAQRLEMSQPSVSQHIQALEEHFGQPLFTRIGRHVELTDAGMVLVPLARELVELTTHIQDAMISLNGGVYGRLVVGCASCTGRYLLPRLLAGFHRQYPQVQTACRVSTREWALQAIADGEVQLALFSDPPLGPDLEFHPFAEERVVLIAPLAHPWALRGEIEKAELPEADFILPEEGSDAYDVLLQSLAKGGLSINQLKTVVTLGSQEAVALSVMEGLGVGFVPELLVSRMVPGRVACIQVHGFDLYKEIYAGRSARRRHTAAQDAFWNFIIQEEMQKK